jgi:hypothetical protein
MAEQNDKQTAWTGRELFDANGRKIGTISGLGYQGDKFGTGWLLVETAAAARQVFVPVDQIRSSGDRLVLPYPLGYVESAPAIDDGRPLSQAEERRLCLHYGIDYLLPGTECLQGCGLCRARRRAERRAEAG